MRNKVKAFAITMMIVFGMGAMLFSLPKQNQRDLTTEESDIRGSFSGTFYFHSGYNHSIWIDTENITTNGTAGIRLMGGTVNNTKVTVENGTGVATSYYAYLFNGSGGNGSVAFSFAIPDYLLEYDLSMIAIKVGRMGEPNGILVVSIRNATNDTKPGTEIVNITLNTSVVPEGAGGAWLWLNVTSEGTPLTLQNGTYFVVLYSNSTNMNSSINYYVALAPDPDHPSGEGAYSEDKSTTLFLNYTDLSEINNPNNWTGDDLYDVFFMYNGTRIPRNQSIAVRFSASEALYIDMVSLYMRREGSSDAVLSISIRNGTDVPGNNTIVSANLSSSNIPLGNYSWIKVDLNDTILEPGDYYLSINVTSGNTENSIILWRANFDPGIMTDLDGYPIPEGTNDTENRTIVRVYRGGEEGYLNSENWRGFDDICDVWARIFLMSPVSGLGNVSIENYTKIVILENDSYLLYYAIFNYSDVKKFYAAKFSITGSITTLNAVHIFAIRNGTPPLNASLVIELRNASGSVPSSNVLARWFVPPSHIPPTGSWIILNSTYEENSSASILLDNGEYFFVFYTNGSYTSTATVSLGVTLDSGTESDHVDEMYVVSSVDLDSWNVTESVDIWLKLNITRPTGVVEINLPENWSAKGAFIYLFNSAILTDWWFNDSVNFTTGITKDIPPMYRGMDIYWNTSYAFEFANSTVEGVVQNINPDSTAIPGIDVIYRLNSGKIAQEFGSHNVFFGVNITAEFMVRCVGSPGGLNLYLVESLSGYPYGRVISNTSISPNNSNWSFVNATFANVNLSIWNYFIVIEPISVSQNDYYELAFSLHHSRKNTLVFNSSGWTEHVGGLTTNVYYSGNLSFKYMSLKVGTWSLTSDVFEIYTVSRLYGGKYSISTSGSLVANFSAYTSLGYLSPIPEISSVEVNDVSCSKLPNGGFYASVAGSNIQQNETTLKFEILLKNGTHFVYNKTFNYIIAVDATFNTNATVVKRNDSIVGFWFAFSGNTSIPCVMAEQVFSVPLNANISDIIELRINNTVLPLNRYSAGASLTIDRIALHEIFGTPILDNELYFVINATLLPKYNVSKDEYAFYNRTYTLNVSSLAYIENITKLDLILISPSGILYNLSFTPINDDFSNWTVTIPEFNETGIWKINIFTTLLGRELPIYEELLVVYTLSGHIELPTEIYAYEEITISVVTYYIPTDRSLRPGAWDHANVTLYIDSTQYNLTSSNNGVFDLPYAPSEGTHEVWAVIETDYGRYTTAKVIFVAEKRIVTGADYTWIYIAVIVAVITTVAAVFALYKRKK
ncbi:MAG: hypothetical protein QXL15_01940 [Candidatus Korarchaeota archaeon]